MLPAIITAPLSLIYGLGVSFRNLLFDMKILKSEEYDIPIVCVGNITVGGTGKTPHTELLVRLLSNDYNVAVLSRGYGRKSKGFILASDSMTARVIGDEPKQIKTKFPYIPVAVCEKRRLGIKLLRESHPEVNLIILDDGFQHRYVEPWLSIILMNYDHPIYDDHLLPWGGLRDQPSSLERAQILIVTKTPKDIKPIEMRIIFKSLNLYPYQYLFFSRIKSLPASPVFDGCKYDFLPKKSKVIAMSAIANNDQFIKQVSENYNIVDTLQFPDHYRYKKKDLNVIEEMLEKYGTDCFIVTTEKDSAKFITSKKIGKTIRERMFKVPIKVEFVNYQDANSNVEDVFLEKIKPYVRENQKYNTLNP